MKNQQVPWMRISAEGAAIVIRIRLAKWPDWLEDIHTNDLSVRDFAFREITPYLSNHGIPRVLFPEGEYACAPEETVPPDYIALADDPKLRAMLIFRRTPSYAQIM